jgi:tripartite-type tricarboxylate transporter receptor subunit TctC
LWQRTRMKRAGKSLAAQVVSPCIKNLSQGGAKMSFSTMRNLMLLSLVMVGVMSTPVLAEEYPERPIEVIVAFGPGGGTDVAARTIEPFIEKYLDEDLVIMNKPGAGGEVGFSLLAASNPDGYTMGFINLPAMFAYSYARETQYSRESFAPIANLVYDPGIFAVREGSQITTLEELIEYGKNNPGALPIGTSGSVGSSEHLAILQVESKTGAKFNHVPFGSTSTLRTALLGGHVPVAAFNLSEAVEYQNEGAIIILGVMDSQRSDTAPNVPTFKEVGIDLISGSSRGLAFPADVPPEIVAKVSEAVAKAMADPEYVAKAEQAGVPLSYMGPEEYGEFLKTTDEGLAEAWKNDPWVK